MTALREWWPLIYWVAVMAVIFALSLVRWNWFDRWDKGD